jgi:autotransporter-associated beta strand protein
LQAGNSWTLLTAGSITGGFTVPTYYSYGETGEGAYQWGAPIPQVIAEADLPALSSGLVWELKKEETATGEALVLCVANPQAELQIVDVTPLGAPEGVKQLCRMRFTADVGGLNWENGLTWAFTVQAQGRVDVGSGLAFPTDGATVGNWNTVTGVEFDTDVDENGYIFLTRDADGCYTATLPLQVASNYQLRLVENMVDGRQYVSEEAECITLMPTIEGVGLQVIEGTEGLPTWICSNMDVSIDYDGVWARNRRVVAGEQENMSAMNEDQGSGPGVYGDQWYGVREDGRIIARAMLQTPGSTTDFLVHWTANSGTASGFDLLTGATGGGLPLSAALGNPDYMIFGLQDVYGDAGGCGISWRYAGRSGAATTWDWSYPANPWAGFFTHAGVQAEIGRDGYYNYTLTSGWSYITDLVVAPDHVRAIVEPGAKGEAPLGVHLSWNDESDNEVGFLVERGVYADSSTEVTWTSLGTVAGSSFTDTLNGGRISGDRLVYRVSAVGSGGGVAAGMTTLDIAWKRYIYVAQSSAVTVSEPTGGEWCVMDGSTPVYYALGATDLLTIEFGSENRTLTLDQTNLPLDHLAHLEVVGTGADTLVVEGGTVTLGRDLGALTENWSLVLDSAEVEVAGDSTVGSVSGVGSVVIDPGAMLAVAGNVGGVTVTNDGVLAFAPSGSITVSSVIEGTGIVCMEGTGTVVLAADNTYTGGTELLSGVLVLGSSAALNQSEGTITFAGGALGLSTACTYDYTPQYTLEDGQGYALAVGEGEVMTLTTALAGHALTKLGAGTLVLSGVFDGAETLTVDAGVLVLEGNGAVAGLVVNDGALTIQNDETIDPEFLTTVSANTLTITGDGNVTVDRSVLSINQSTVMNGDGATVQLISTESYQYGYYGTIASFWGGDTMTLGGTSVKIAGDGHFGGGTITAASGVNVNLMPGIIAATMEATPNLAGVIDFPGVVVLDLSAANEVTTWINVYPPGYPWGDCYINSYLALSNFMTFNDNTVNRVIVANAGDTAMNGQTFAPGTSFQVIVFNYMNTITLWSGSAEVLGDQGHANIQGLGNYWYSEGGPWIVSTDGGVGISI